MLTERVIKGDTAVSEAVCFDEDMVTPVTATTVSWDLLKPDASTYAITLAAAATPTLALNGTGTLSGTYQYLQTYLVTVSAFSYETPSSAVASIAASLNTIRITASDITAITGVTKRRIYRRKSGTTTWQLVIESATLTAFTYDDTAADNALTTGIQPVFETATSTARFRTLDTALPGSYTVVHHFTLLNTNRRSVVSSFEIIDPLSQSSLDVDKTVDLTWRMLNDCFDSDAGGPYLRDASLANFDKMRLKELIDLAIFTINNYQPPQAFDSTTFPYANARPLLAKALLLEAVKHLMRSYVEQPQVTGAGQISYFERRDYLERWQIIYTMEAEEFKLWLVMFKRQQYNFGSSKLLVDSKQGRKLYYPALRTRYPRIGGYM